MIKHSFLSALRRIAGRVAFCIAPCALLIGDLAMAQSFAPPTITWRSRWANSQVIHPTPESVCRFHLPNVNGVVFSHISPELQFAPPDWAAVAQFCWYQDNRVDPPQIYSYETALADYRCPPNIQMDDRVCRLPAGMSNPEKQCGSSCPRTPRPINPALGNKFFVHSDLTPGDQGGVAMRRYYNSITPSAQSVPGAKARYGNTWRGEFDRFVYRNAMINTTATVYRQDGRGFVFRYIGSSWISEADVQDRLEHLGSISAPTGWRYVSAAKESVESYDAAGKLVSIVERNGLGTTLDYDSSGRLITVTGAYGRPISLSYDVTGRVMGMVDGAGAAYAYSYNSDGNLATVTYPDASILNYLYNEAAFTGGTNLPNALTGIVDENGVRYGTFRFDSAGRAIGSELGVGQEPYQLTYTATGSTVSAATITDPLGTTNVYAFDVVLGVGKNTTVTGPTCPSCGPSSQTFDANGNIASRTDWNGNKTCYGYDLARNLETRRVEGLPSGANCATYLTGTPTLTGAQRMVSTVWSSDWRLPVQVAEPLKITTYTYGAPNAGNPGDRGNVLSRSVQATTDATGALGLTATLTGSPRTTVMTYNANGSVLTMDGPRTDAADTTTYTYYANNDSDIGKRGNVATVTNAAGHTTTITSYNAHGQPTGITDPNGLTTTLTYDSRLRLTSRSVGGEITGYQYDGVGQLTQVTMPDGSQITYTYDAAHRLTGMADNLGNRIAYTLDLMGNRTKEDVFDPANQLAQTRSRVYNALNRLTQDIGAQNQTTQYAYDNQGNLTQVTDPLNRITSNSYDALNRLTAMTQPQVALPGGGTASPVIAYGYNGQDQLTQVTDPRSLVTSYAYDGLGNLNQQVSPDTGMTSNTYDAAGNILTSTDAKGQTTAYAYDALNRVVSLTYNQATGSQLRTVTYQYDQSNAQSANGVGRLTTVTETAANNAPLQTTQYSYDQKGRLTQETRTLAGNANPYVTSYTYDQSNGRMTGMTYPSGRTLAYGYDTIGRINQISTTNPANATVNPGQTQLLATNIQYHPSVGNAGGVKSYTLGNNQTVTRSYDQDGRIASYTLGGNSTSIGYDAASRIVSLLDTANAANSNSYGYDNLDRLIQTVLPNTTHSYQYDLTGNRVSKAAGAATDAYSIAPNSNRIAQIVGADTKLFAYDANGSTINDGNNSYGYDARGRMVQATSSFGTTTYQVNAMGQRVRKTGLGNAASATIGDTVFHYDAQGKLIAETTPTGTLKKEYLYLLDLPVAVSVQ